MLVTKEQAIKLKEMGFDKQCLAYYRDGILYDCRLKQIENSSNMIDCNNRNNTSLNHCSTPTISQALDFMREEKGIECAVMLEYEKDFLQCFYYGEYITKKTKSHAVVENTETCNTHSEASLALLDAVIKHIEENEKD